MPCVGTVNARILYENKSIDFVPILITTGLHNQMLISLQDLKKLKVIHEDFPRSHLNKVSTTQKVQRDTHTTNSTFPLNSSSRSSVRTHTHAPSPAEASTSSSNHETSLTAVLDSFPSVFDETKITRMQGPSMHIYLDRHGGNYRPCRTLTARPIPLHYQEEAAKTIKLFIDSEVIAKVDYPTEWISPAFFVPKPDGRVRLVTDFTGINRFISRPVHPFLCPQDIIKGILPGSKYFITLDAVQGYYQVPLDNESADLTTFLLPDGKYKFLRAPMGLKPSSDEWCQRSDIVFANIPGLLKIVDDILIQAPNKVQALKYLKKVLHAAKTHEITLAS